MPDQHTVSTIVVAAQDAGYESCTSTLVSAVLNGTAMIATTGAGVSPALRDFILASGDRYGNELT